ncbi:MAG: hypothetical protein UR12_C0013G0027 [candidate division TM6 bacterium GW2011_GWF2_30_66]|jgi:hypothetical protein|nr:MAG: hypothetical protein UR12_C0013G0027 [candidate division TM6 bacterium GW2011_GWF2_30_66]
MIIKIIKLLLLISLAISSCIFCTKNKNKPKSFFTIELDLDNINQYLEEIEINASQEKFDNYLFKIIINGNNSLYKNAQKISSKQIEKLIDIQKNNLIGLVLYSIDIEKVFQNNIIKILSESNIRFLKISSCTNINADFLKNLPKKLEILILKNNFYIKENLFSDFNFSKSLTEIDISEIDFNASEDFFKGIPRNTKKLKLGCTIKDSHLLKHLPKTLTSLCLKKASIENLNPNDLPPKLFKFCPNNKFKSDNFKNLPKISIINFANSEMGIEKNTDITGKNFEFLPKSLKTIIINPSILFQINDDQIQNFPENIELVIKKNWMNFNFSSNNIKINELKKHIKKVTIIEYKDPEFDRIIPKSDFVSNSNLEDLESPSSFGDLSGLASPDSETNSPKNQSLKKNNK